MSPLRHAIIGVGASILPEHLKARCLETTAFVAATDVNVELGTARAHEIGCRFYRDLGDLLAQEQPDIAVVLTPHPFHAALAVQCLEAGCHVLVEKPMATKVSEADAMVGAGKRAGRLLAVNFQQRFRPEVVAAKRYLEAGGLGALQHVDITKAWPRPKVYYDTASWRATWRGEGGGVLMNQAPHDLDLLIHLLGAPRRVAAWTRNLLHNTQTEDTVQAMIDWPSGALGSLHISTAEGGRAERIELIGTGGTMLISEGSLEVTRFEPDFAQFSATTLEKFGRPSSAPVTLELPDTRGDHVAVYRNLHAAILEGEALIADSAAGRISLELANAMILSSYTRLEVELPLDRARYEALLEKLKAERPVTR